MIAKHIRIEPQAQEVKEPLVIEHEEEEGDEEKEAEQAEAEVVEDEVIEDEAEVKENI